MKKPARVLAFALGGGGARGALQVGALRALLEAGVHPDLLVGTSIGAVNAAYLAMHGFSRESLTGLESAWQDAAHAGLLPDNYVRIALRTLLNRTRGETVQRAREFCVRHGLGPDLCFRDLQGPRLFLVSADLNGGQVVLYGTDPGELVLEGVLASAAIPPWIMPRPRGDRLLIDGGLLSNVPIEPAMSQGATEIVALDLDEPRPIGPAHGIGPFVSQMMHTLHEHQVHLEKQLASARGVRVHHVPLTGDSPVAVWEFERAPALIDVGYQSMRRYLADHPELAGPEPVLSRWRRLLQRLSEVAVSARGRDNRPGMKELGR
jgi:NTE family protein